MAFIIPKPVFTSEIKKQIAVFVASTIRPLSASFSLLHRNYDYVRRAMRELMEQDVLTYTKDQPRAVRFTPWGLERLREEMPMAYDYYMVISNGNNPGSGKAHHLLMRRQGDVQSCMMAAKVQIGGERPLLSKTALEDSAKTPLSAPVYLPTKEIKAIKNEISMQKNGIKVAQNREQISRASGILFSPVMDALVYDIVGDEGMRVYKSVEMKMQSQIKSMKITLWRMRPESEIITHCIAFYGDEQRVLSAIETYRRPDKKKPQNQTKPQKSEQKMTAEQEKALKALRDRTTIYRAMTDISEWPRTSFHLLPNNEYGAWCLWLLTDNTEKEIYEAVTRTDDGKRMNIEYRNGVLYVQGKEPCEYLTCRIRALDSARKKQKTSGSNEPVTVLCWPHQTDFVSRFFDETPCEIIEISLNDVTVELLI